MCKGFGKGWHCCSPSPGYEWFRESWKYRRRRSYSRSDELADLQDYREFLQEELNYVKERISELERTE
jgi:hypothetical protein